jgi:hypothetical protein
VVELRYPKGLTSEEFAWALRRGVALAMMSRGRTEPIRRAGGASVIASRTLLRLADQVRREWLRRHPRHLAAELVTDYVVPLSAGGSMTPENTRTSSRLENLRKGTR